MTQKCVFGPVVLPNSQQRLRQCHTARMHPAACAVDEEPVANSIGAAPPRLILLAFCQSVGGGALENTLSGNVQD